MTPLAVFSGPWGWLIKWGVIVVLFLSGVAFGWVKGNDHGTEKLTDYIGKQAVAVQKLTAARTKVIHDVTVEYRDRIHTVTVKGDTIIKEVPVYVTKADDAGCAIPVGFVREYDAMWTNTPAGPPVDSDRRPSGVQLSTVATSDAGNAKSCFWYKEQRDGLIKMYRGLQAAQPAR